MLRIPRALRQCAVVGALALAVAGAGAGPALASSNTVSVDLSPASSQVGAFTEAAPGASYGHDADVGYGGTLTVQFPAQSTPGAGTTFLLWFGFANGVSYTAGPGYHDTFSTDTSIPSYGPLTVTDLGGNAYRIDIPAVTDVINSPQPLNGYLQVDGLTTTLPGGLAPGPGSGTAYARLGVTVGGPASASLATHLSVTSYLPTAAANAGGTVQLTLPTSSALYVAGLTSLADAQITLQKANAGNLTEDWGPSEPVTVQAAADGRSATMQIPRTLAGGVYALQVKLDQPHLFIAGSFLVNLAGANAGLRSATGWDEHQPAASDGLSWPVYAGGALVLVAAVAGAALIATRRRAAARG